MLNFNLNFGKRVYLIACIAFMVVSSLESAQLGPVDSLDVFSEILKSARAGDTIVIANGTYSDWAVEIECSGTEDHPVTIKPQSKQGVTFTGRTNIVLSGRNIHFTGFLFDQCEHIESPIELDRSQNCRIDDCIFQHSGGEKAAITIKPGARRNIIEHSQFIDIAGRSINLRVNETNNDRDIPFGNIIRKNQFRDIPPLGENGRETVKIGQSQPTNGHIRAGTLVEENSFVRCNGEGEIISNKCAANIYRRNTFTDCDGELVMRGGRDCLIEANRLINCRGGIRLSGSHHTVRDNVIINSRGTGIRLLFGMTKEQGGHYQAPSHCTIENNTIINAAQAGILIGDGKDKDWKEKGIQNVPPSENHFRNNLVICSTKNLFITNNASDNTFANNLQYHSSEIEE